MTPVPAIFFPLVLSAAAPESAGLVYQPHGDAIVPRNGSRWDNRPLGCLRNPF
jgi:hypothetical protein